MEDSSMARLLGKPSTLFGVAFSAAAASYYCFESATRQTYTIMRAILDKQPEITNEIIEQASKTAHQALQGDELFFYLPVGVVLASIAGTAFGMGLEKIVKEYHRK